MATAQRPLTLAGKVEKSTAPAWKTIPSWYLVGRQDRIFTAAAQRFMAKRAHAHTVEIDSSHAVYLSHPGAVAKLVVRAARATAG
jgi:pimeloyl-ACP methyl ester carboxylesterase